MQSVTINGQERVKTGKSASNAYRRSGLVPCVLYSKDENIQFNADPGELKTLIYTPDFKLANIVLGGNTHRCIMKELQFHPITDAVIHIDFLKLVEGTTIKVDVPLKLTGSAVGVKSGGKLLQKVRALKIKTVPEKMVHEIKVDVTALDLGQSMRIREIENIDGIEILNASGIPFVTVEIPRALKSATAEVAATPAAGPAKAAAGPAAKAPPSKK